MGVFDRIKSVLGSKPVIAPPEHRLDTTEAPKANAVSTGRPSPVPWSSFSPLAPREPQ
jgi:hypothetical protein